MREEHHDLGGDPGPPSAARQSRAPRDSLHFGPLQLRNEYNYNCETFTGAGCQALKNSLQKVVFYVEVVHVTFERYIHS